MDKLDKLKDIKPLLDINDNSVYILASLIVAILLVLAIIVVIYKKITTIKQASLQKQALKFLHTIDFKDSKKSAYSITKYGYILVDTEDKNIMFEELNKMLSEYKYKKEVPNIEIIVKQKLDNFIKVCEDAK